MSPSLNDGPEEKTMNASYRTPHTGLFDSLCAVAVALASIGVMVGGVLPTLLA